MTCMSFISKERKNNSHEKLINLNKINIFESLPVEAMRVFFLDCVDRFSGGGLDEHSSPTGSKSRSTEASTNVLTTGTLVCKF